MLIQFQQPIDIGSMFLFKVKPNLSLSLERTQLTMFNKPGDSYTFRLQDSHLCKIQKWTNQLKRQMPYGQFLNVSVPNNLLVCKVPRVKGISQIISNELIEGETRKFVNINIYIDTIYKFKNNPKNYYFKFKLKEIDYIS